MTQSDRQPPQAGIADALSELSEQTGLLVRREIEAAQHELIDKVKDSAPGVAMLAAAGALSLLAAASSYRLSLRLLEKLLPPASAACVATGVYGAGAAYAAWAGLQRLREAPLPFPTETVQESAALASDAAREARGRT